MEFGYSLKIKFINMKEMIKRLSLYFSHITFICIFHKRISRLLPPSECIRTSLMIFTWMFVNLWIQQTFIVCLIFIEYCTGDKAFLCL